MTASATATEPLLRVEGVVAGFGATTVLHGVSFDVADGEVSGVFGLNGAGKSVTMKVLAGIVPLREGVIRFQGTDISSLSAEESVRTRQPRRAGRQCGEVGRGVRGPNSAVPILTSVAPCSIASCASWASRTLTSRRHA